MQLHVAAGVGWQNLLCSTAHDRLCLLYVVVASACATSTSNLFLQPTSPGSSACVQLAFGEKSDGGGHAQGSKCMLQKEDRMRGGIRDQGLVTRTNRMSSPAVCCFAFGSSWNLSACSSAQFSFLAVSAQWCGDAVVTFEVAASVCPCFL